MVDLCPYTSCNCTYLCTYAVTYTYNTAHDDFHRLVWKHRGSKADKRIIYISHCLRRREFNKQFLRRTQFKIK